MPQKDKATFVRILNKYLDPRWSDQDLADAVGVKDRSTANRWKDAGQPTMPQGETLDKLVQVLKITDEADRFLLYGAAGYLAPPADAAVQATLPDIVAVIFNYLPPMACRRPQANLNTTSANTWPGCRRPMAA